MSDSRTSALRGALLALVMLALVSMLLPWSALPGRAEEGEQPIDDVPAPEVLPFIPTVDPAIEAVWRQADGAVADGAVARAWLFGPQPVAIATEGYRDSPTGRRVMVYYDKGRLEILDPSKDPADPWYVSGALLVAEMLSGDIQFGEDVLVHRDPAAIPIVGDPGQPDAPTYATLAPLASVARTVAPKIGALGPTPVGGTAANVAEPKVGRPITALLTPRGTVRLDAVSGAAARFGKYDPVTGHNIAAPFVTWAAAQPLDPLWLLGRPLTEPYWVDTTLDGAPARVLLQAFERRVLTWNPANPEGWQVESANVGLHYRQWRNLAQPADEFLLGLASNEPFGEELVAAATAHLIDPYMFVALALTASNGDPLARQANGGYGLLAVRPSSDAALLAPVGGEATSEALTRTGVLRRQVARTRGQERAERAKIQAEVVLIDPARNSGLAAVELARWMPQSLDWRSILANYYSGGNPNWDDPALVQFVDATLAMYATLTSIYPQRPEPAAGESGALLGVGHAAYYSPSYDTAWWERTLRLYESWGTIAPGWLDDPNGYYCVRPGYIPGERLLLVANGVTIVCTIGDTVATPHLASWRAHWVVELSWSAFVALGLPANNMVEVYHLGLHAPPPMPEPPVEETPVADPPAEETPPAEEPPAEEPPATPTEVPTATPEPTPTPTQPPADGTPTPEPSPVVEPVREPEVLIASGVAGRTPGALSRAWWEATLAEHARLGHAVEGWQPDPLGFYCLHPDYLPGERLRVVAGEREITCTVGDIVPTERVEEWRAAWVVELNDAAWEALALDPLVDGGDRVDLYYAPPPVAGDTTGLVTAGRPGAD